MLGAAALSAPALALSGLPAEAYQGNMERALSALGAAMESSQAATPNKAAIASGPCGSSDARSGKSKPESISPTEGAAIDAAPDSERGRHRPARLRFPLRRPARF
jgi:hypothetical protein